jgi:cytochrome c5
MAVNYSTAVRIGMLDSIETAVGTSPNLLFYSGAKPTACSDAASGTLVATLALTGNSGDWMSAASAAGNVVTKVKNPASTWSATAVAAGTVGYYRIYNQAGSVCHEQGTVTATGGGGDMTIDNPVVAIGQTITVTGKTITAGNA